MSRADRIAAERRRRLVKAYEGLAGCKPGTRTWYAAAAAVLRYGEEGAKKLAPAVEARCRSTMRAYQAAFNKAARGHCKDMVEKGFFSHTSPVPGKATPRDRARRAGTTANGENIAYGTTEPQRANQMWFHSPGHFKNMFGPRFRRVGLGYHERRWTQMFGR